MLITFLYTISSLAALVSAIAAIRYPFTCKALRRHLASPRPNRKTAQVAFKGWCLTRGALDKVRLHTGGTAICAYAVGMVANIPLWSLLSSAEGTSMAPMVIVLVLTLASLTVAFASIFHNDSEPYIDI